MGELFGVLVALVFFFGLIAVVGHGIWVLVARLLAYMFGSATPRDDIWGVRRNCPRCLSPRVSDESQTCSVCDWPKPLPHGERRLNVALAVRRQLTMYQKLGLIGESAAQRLIDALATASTTAEVANSALAPVPAHEAETAAVAASVEPVAAELVDAELVEPHLVDIAAASEVAPSPAAAAMPHPLPNVEPTIALTPAMAEVISVDRRRLSLGNFLSAFLEEKNIRWGELVGGLLIVGCSVALVISFWAEIAERPLLKFGMFNSVSAALFGMGLYTYQRWKLHTTSRGLLIVALLLVPLNFLTIAAFTLASPPTDAPSILGESASLLLLGFLSYRAALILTPSAAWPLTIGVMFPSLLQLLARRFVDADESPVVVHALTGLPLVCYAGAVGLAMRPHAAERALDEPSANRLYMLLGIATFAMAPPIALVVYKSGDMAATLQRLSPWCVAAGAPAVAAGLLVWRKLAAPTLVREQTAGIAVGVLGAAVMVAALVVAWPNPGLFCAAAIANAVAFAFLAVWLSIPPAHLAASVCAMFAWLVIGNVMTGDLGWRPSDDAYLGDALFSARSGNLLAPLFALFFGIAFALRRYHRIVDSKWWTVAAAVVAVASLLLIGLLGLGRSGDPENVTWTVTFFALVAQVKAGQSRRTNSTSLVEPGNLATAAAWLALVAIIQGIVFRYGEAWNLENPWTLALLAYTTAAMSVVSLPVGRSRLIAPLLRRAHFRLASMATVVAIALIVVSASVLPWSTIAAYLAWLAVVWLVMATFTRRPRYYFAFQTALAGAISCGVTEFVSRETWYQDSALPLLDPRYLQAVGIALAIYAAASSGLRWCTRRYLMPGEAPAVRVAKTFIARRWTTLINVWPWSFDRLCEAALVGSVVILSIYAALPGVAQELAPLDRPGLTTRVVPPASAFELLGIPHEPAGEQGAWLLLVAVALALFAGLWTGAARLRGLGLLLVAAAACLLTASAWSDSVSVASALRWLIAGFFIVASIPVWNRHVFAPWLRGIGIDLATDDARLPQPGAKAFRTSLISIVVGSYVAMVAYVALAAVSKAGVPAEVAPLINWLAGLSVIAALIALLVGLAEHDETRAEPSAGDAHVDTSDPSLSPAERRRKQLQVLILFLGASPLVVTSIFIVAAALRQHPLVGPEPGAWFREIGWSASYGVPLVVFAVGLVGHAIRERSAPLVFAAGLLFNLVATVVFMLELSRAGRPLDGAAWMQVAQVNAIVCALLAHARMASMTWVRSRVGIASPTQDDDAAKLVDDSAEPAAEPVADSQRDWPGLLTSQVLMSVALCALPLLPALVGLFLRPDPWPWVSAAGGPGAWVAAALVVAAGARWMGPPTLKSLRFVGVFAALAVAHVALALAWFYPEGWIAYHALLAGVVTASWLMLVGHGLSARLGLLNRSWRRAGHRRAWPRWSTLFGAVAVVLALRAADGDPQWPDWTLAALAATAALAVCMAWIAIERRMIWIAGTLAHIAVSIWWYDVRDLRIGIHAPDDLTHFLLTHVVVAALAALVSVVVERLRIQPALSTTARGQSSVALCRYHEFAAWLCIAFVAIPTAVGLSDDFTGLNYRWFGGITSAIDAHRALALGAIAAMCVAAAGSLWDLAPRLATARLYSAAFVVAAVALDDANLVGDSFLWAANLALAGFALASSLTWNRRDAFRSLAGRCRIVWTDVEFVHDGTADSRKASGWTWMALANGLLAAIVTALVFWMELNLADENRRSIAAVGLLAAAGSLALFALGPMRLALQSITLALGVLFAVALGWSRLPEGMEAAWLHRLVVAMVACAAVATVYGLGIAKWPRLAAGWGRASRQFVPTLALVTTILLFAVLGIEVSYFLDEGAAPIRYAALVAVLVTLVGLVVAALGAAVLPGRDPLGLSERGRTVYVYAAEILLALTFLHIRITMPWLFSGWFSQFWPLVIVAISFIGVGFAEWCRRRRLNVLSTPLENTGALLPLLPTLGFWLLPSQINYSLLLLSVSALYSVLCLLRKSFLFGVLATLAANASLWYLLGSFDGMSLWEHPQLWFIPPALCVLVASHFNRARLSGEQMTAIRYLSATVIYASSTGDVFLKGVGEAPWLPVVLAALSLVGIFAGILLRVRGFVYLGLCFLMVALFTVIWYAAVELERTWIWWITGIVTGVLIIALFGLFEKRRDDLLRIVDELKRWDA